MRGDFRNLSESTESKLVKVYLDELYNQVLQADENGLFSDTKTKPMFDSIRTKIFDAFSALEVTTTHKQVELLKAREVYFNAYHELSQAIELRGWQWRLLFKYAFPSFFYLIFLSLFIFWLSRRLPVAYFGIPTWVLLLGALGGLGQAIWYLWQQVSSNSYRKSWIPWAVSSPILGSIFGLILYLIYSGFISATSSASSQFATGPGPMLVTLVGGFSWRARAIGVSFSAVYAGQFKTIR